MGSILQTSGNFALLGGTAITSTGVSGTVLTDGNVGLSPGATTGITGFPPAVIQNGAIIATGTATNQARLDLIKVQVGLANMPFNATMSNVDLGGKTLLPGVYKFDGAATQNGALVLDAQGRNGAFWVFQIGTSLITSSNSSVTVINLGTNGGSDCGIFWNAGSAITIGGNNRIAGNYLAGTSITFGATSNGGGRALALAGITLDNNQIDAKGGPSGADWDGGLKYDALGAVVPNPSLAFSYEGNQYRFTRDRTRFIRGDTTVTATTVQWRLNLGGWNDINVGYAGKWTLAIDDDILPFGQNTIRLRARDAHGNVTEVKKVYIRHRRS